MKRIVTASALRELAEKILKLTKNDEADEVYFVDFDKVLDEIVEKE